MPTVETNGIRTYYERRGSGPPIVFIHGAILHAGYWDPQVAALEDDFTTITYDVRGHGRTGPSDRERYSIDLFADDLDALLDAMDIELPILCGLSTGGCIAQVYAARHPEKIAGVVLAETFTPDVLSWTERLQRAQLQATIPLARLVGFERVERAMVWAQERFSPDAGGDYESIAGLREDAPTMRTDEFAKVIRAIGRFEDADIDFAAFDVPTLVLYGENELGFIKAHAARLGAAIPGAELTMIPDAGHASNVDNPDFFSEAVREFARRVSLPEQTAD